MTPLTPKTTYLKDYTPPEYLIERVDLSFHLNEAQTTVRSHLEIARNPQRGTHTQALVLDGQELRLSSLQLDGEPLAPDRYHVDEEQLTIPDVPPRFALDITTHIRPQENTSLEGLYRSGDTFCTQCEAQGFRKITYFLDRPDVLARYTTTITADRNRYPVLLSNGNRIAGGVSDGQRHWATWEDPFPKPCYLFALVAGNLVGTQDEFTTHSGKAVKLQIYVERHNSEKCGHAMRSLKKAMRWDEETFNLEYDLDTYMIVAVDDFNMGAMENKGLNVFNSKYVLARPETATDADYAGIENVIGHEYFHNWTGNRITCRDWFQLSLKEGLTVFRDQLFSAAMSSGPARRIREVRLLREYQFAEDAGPMAHPVRPDSYIEISNFYTLTVYNKGAEVIRMLNTLLGEKGFRRGLALYLCRHDGQAATTDDFVQAMEDATGTDLGQFRLWYSQAGTPVLTVVQSYDENARRYTLSVAQHCPSTAGQPHKKPIHIPLAVALLDHNGQELPLRFEGESALSRATTRILSITRQQESFSFVGVTEEPTASLLRGFSAPVNLAAEFTDAQLAFLFAHDTDPFNRWNAGQELATRLMLRLMATPREAWTKPAEPAFIAAVASILGDETLDKALAAEALALPTEIQIANQMDVIDVAAIHEAREFLRLTLSQSLKTPFQLTYHANRSDDPYRYDPVLAGRRSLKNTCLAYLMLLNEPDFRALCVAQFHRVDNMTDALGALAPLAHTDCPERQDALAQFEQRWQDDPLVMDKWFSIQASSPLPQTVIEVKRLLEHPRFDLKNPNKVRALIGTFCHHNQVRFHQVDGEGYRLVAECIRELDPLNPQVAARLLNAFSRWRRFDTHRQALMQYELEQIFNLPKLSRDTFEIASKTLMAAEA
ncbi:MAG: aminopeptidase N [Gammaproteobacteria bacterium]|jgi:aminopeptidase N